MRYELALVFKPLSTDEIKDKVIPKIEKYVKEANGTLTLKSTLGKRLLAYPIEKYKEAVYFFYTLDIGGDKLVEFNKFLTFNLSDELLRSLLIDEKEL